ncbi:SMI1/KNR4 family protein [Bacillus sp. S/N-304-OC-R1]|uniref:SMI1/KNR4 family protein n=1 Tax=Bacillus sp. S/N-304-OC-R1 TaxID=2758034 RepID=UPI001C8D1441|nr:SMI1/KNR4 family protein [Bacillus sp. S/N-304-OC-R1]MBY0124387.1 SMI1/KNR4 family protein [Bacillus sp. S/N-304-OC-R1]
MSNINNLIENSKAMTIGNVDYEVIREAESQLRFTFPQEYRNFIESFGSLACGSNEVFGLGTNDYLNVVNATQQERDLNENMLESYIVIQNLGVEGILIVMDADGTIYEYRNNEFKKLYDSFYDFLKQEIL